MAIDHEVFSGIRVVVDTNTKCAMCNVASSKRGVLCVDNVGRPHLCCRQCSDNVPTTDKPRSTRPLPLTHALAFVSRDIASRYSPENSSKAQQSLSALCQSYNVGPFSSGLRAPETYAPQSAWKSTLALRFSCPPNSQSMFIVIEVVEDSPAWYQGLRPRDVFVKFGELNREEFIANGSDMNEVAKLACKSFFKPLHCIIIRSGRAYDIELQATQWEHGFVLGALINQYPFVEIKSSTQTRFKKHPEWHASFVPPCSLEGEL